MYAAVRLRGKVGIRDELEDTLKMLNLKKKFNCTLLPETEDYEGMLQKVSEFVTWGQVDEEVAKKILEKNSDKADEALKALDEGKSLSKVGIKRSFSLAPPSGGFNKSTKKPYPKGEAGKREDGIDDLLKRMI